MVDAVPKGKDARTIPIKTAVRRPIPRIGAQQNRLIKSSLAVFMKRITQSRPIC